MLPGILPLFTATVHKLSLPTVYKCFRSVVRSLAQIYHVLEVHHRTCYYHSSNGTRIHNLGGKYSSKRVVAGKVYKETNKVQKG